MAVYTRYDDSESQKTQERYFDESRKRNEEIAKEQEKFSKKLLGVKTLVTGIDSAIENKADYLDSQELPQYAHYFSELENSQTWRTMYDQYVKEGLSEDQMFLREREKMLRTYLQGHFGEEFNIDSYNPAITRLAKDYTPDQLRLFKETLKRKLAVPNLSKEELTTIIREQGAAPRDIAALLTGSIRKQVKSHTKETIDSVNQKETRRQLQGLIGDQFTSARKALEDYNAQGNPIDKLIEFMKTDKAKELEVYKNAQRSAIKTTELQDGVWMEKEYIIAEAFDDSGNLIEVGRLEAHSRIIEQPEVKFNSTELAVGVGHIDVILNDIDNGDYDEAYKAYDSQEAKYALANSIMTIRDQITKLDNNISKDTAMSIATNYFFSQKLLGENPTGTISSFDIDLHSNNVDDSKLNEYIKSIKKTKPKSMVQHELKKMKKIIAESLPLTYKDDELVSQLNSFNQILENNNVTTLDQDAEALANATENGKDMDKEVEEIQEPLSVEEMISKYKINEELINTLRTIKPIRGNVTQNAPGREDPIDMITDQMLYESGYLRKGKDAPFFKMRARRKFLIDFYKDLGLL